MTTKPQKYLITSALPYVNGTKHLGNLVGSMLPGDVFARFLRQTGRDVVYICATDEHGTPTEIAAAEEGLPVADYAAKMHEVQKDIYTRFGIRFDHFGRTSRQQNIEITQHFAERIHAGGYTEVRTMRQLYSVDDGRFLPDRYVTGTCPHCGYDKARGDQCENCTRLLDPADLKNPRSTISGSTNLEFRDTSHLFLLLPKLADKVRAWVDSREEWPALVKSIAYKWLDDGLQERCITRDLSWGVPVNVADLRNKVFYVWFDAPIGYIAATKEWADLDPQRRDWKAYWYNADSNVRYVQFMAKDNIPFHTVSFPASIIATGEPWKQVDYLKGFNWLNYYGGKFSTSSKIGIFTHDALELLPPDYWRYYLMARAPEGSDATFTWEDFQGVVNKDLVGVIGNSVNRIVRFTINNFDGQIPAMGARGEVETKYAAQFADGLARYNAELEAMSFRKALEALRGLWVTVNEYLAEGAPWTALKTDRDMAASRVNMAFNMIFALVPLTEPMMPFTAAALAKAFAIEGGPRWYTDAGVALTQAKDARAFADPGLLFRRLEDDEVAAWKERFGGK
jgi:methionyl-tRNA synthetase